MSIDDRDVVALGSSGWPERPRQARRPVPSPLQAYLLDADGDLAEELDVRTRLAVRPAATARVIEADSGDCELGWWLAEVGDGPGLLILDGLVAADTRVSNRTVTELLGSGDLLQPLGGHLDDLIERVASWRALGDCRFALLDGDFAERVRPWPQIGRALLRRTERRAEELGVLRAISCQPKLEVRLVLFLWHLAARWGKVEPSGIRLMMPLTHRLLGQLVSAERPSISHALSRLTDAGLVSGMAGDWHLHGSLDAHLETLVEGTTRLADARRGDRPGSARSA